MEFIKDFIFNSNINIFYSIIATIVICIIIAIIRKATKAVISLAIACVIVVCAAIYVDSINEKYNLRIEDKSILITIDDKNYDISDFENIQNVYLNEDENIKTTLITIDYIDSEDITFEMPSFMSDRLQKFIKEKTSEVDIIETTNETQN